MLKVRGLLEHLRALEDPRQACKVVYPLPDVLLVVLDGKTMRRSGSRRTGARPLHVVSAWASRHRLVLAQEAVCDKSNEIVPARSASTRRRTPPVCPPGRS